MPLTAGDKLGPYEILALIGSVVEVYRAREPNRTVIDRFGPYRLTAPLS